MERLLLKIDKMIQFWIKCDGTRVRQLCLGSYSSRAYMTEKGLLFTVRVIRSCEQVIGNNEKRCLLRLSIHTMYILINFNCREVNHLLTSLS